MSAPVLPNLIELANTWEELEKDYEQKDVTLQTMRRHNDRSLSRLKEIEVSKRHIGQVIVSASTKHCFIDRLTGV